MATSPAVLESILKGLLDAVGFIRNPENKPQALKSLAKGLRLSPRRRCRRRIPIDGRIYERKIYPSVDGVRNVIRLLGMNNDKIRRLKAEELVDDTVVRKLAKEGRF